MSWQALIALCLPMVCPPSPPHLPPFFLVWQKSHGVPKHKRGKQNTGQTGSGKTYTMEGTRFFEETERQTPEITETDGIDFFFFAVHAATRPPQKNFSLPFKLNFIGIIPRAIQAIFSRLGEAIADGTTSIKVSHLEIYNEELTDLLDTEEGSKHANSTKKDNKKLIIYQENYNSAMKTGNGVVVQGLQETMVHTPQDIYDMAHKLQKQCVSQKRVEKRGKCKGRCWKSDSLPNSVLLRVDTIQHLSIGHSGHTLRRARAGPEKVTPFLRLFFPSLSL